MCHFVDKKRLSLLAHVATTEWLDVGLIAEAYWVDLVSTKEVQGKTKSPESVFKLLLDQNHDALIEAVGSMGKVEIPRHYEYDPKPGRMLDAMAYAQEHKLGTKLGKHDLALQVLLILREYEHQCQYDPRYRFSQAYRIVEAVKNMLCQVLSFDAKIADAFGEGWNDRFSAQWEDEDGQE